MAVTLSSASQAGAAEAFGLSEKTSADYPRASLEDLRASDLKTSARVLKTYARLTSSLRRSQWFPNSMVPETQWFPNLMVPELNGS